MVLNLTHLLSVLLYRLYAINALSAPFTLSLLPLRAQAPCDLCFNACLSVARLPGSCFNINARHRGLLSSGFALLVTCAVLTALFASQRLAQKLRWRWLLQWAAPCRT